MSAHCLTAVLFSSCVLLFAGALSSAWVLAGRRSALVFAGLALSLGWFAEQMGSSRGWFFGRYHYTETLGPEIGNVPMAIALMWFALCWVGYAMACLILWHRPTLAATTQWTPRLLTASLAAMIVTAFDLGADPYFVFVLKAWIMGKTDGGWFGETLQGFAGWMCVSFVIITLFQALLAPLKDVIANKRARLAALLPLAIYGAGLVFQLFLGHPIETRAVAFFAMGMPLFISAVAWWQWSHTTSRELP
jgi:uncharacterized membrane protein